MPSNDAPVAPGTDDARGAVDAPGVPGMLAAPGMSPARATSTPVSRASVPSAPDGPSSISPELLAAVLGRNKPTPQQSEVIGAPAGPMLVVAGAGAGKTETMASRAVWMVANGLVRPDQILGLTFTRKAAQQLQTRIRTRLELFASTPKVRDLDPSGALQTLLTSTQPTVRTYDSYAGQLVAEYGLWGAVEPSSRIITNTEQWAIAHDVVSTFTGRVSADRSVAGLVQMVLDLHGEMNDHQADPVEVVEESRAFVDNLANLPKGPRQRGDGMTAVLQGWSDTQLERIDIVELVRIFRERMRELNVLSFGDQMAIAARLAAQHVRVGAGERARFRVVMLDEYQDTSHSQRVLLRALYGDAVDPGLTVTAVGDPMQSIYGWRGATAANLEAFVHDFPLADGRPAPKMELTTSFRNPTRVLSLANTVSEEVLGPVTKPNRAVAPLQAFADAPGEVSLNWYHAAADEVVAVGEYLEEHYRRTQASDESLSAAVLVRKNKYRYPIAQELASRGIPYEIVGLSGLLSIPEVADCLAYATMLIRPNDNAAALHVLCGPQVNLGAADILALRKRARNLAARATGPSDPALPASAGVGPEGHSAGVSAAAEASAVAGPRLFTTPLELLESQIAAATNSHAEEHVGLSDAIADLGEGTNLSPTAQQRLRTLSAQLRYLRTYSLGKALPDLFADIQDVTGLRTEVLARQDPAADGAAGTVHLEKLLDEVASFAAIPGATLGALLDYFEMAKEQEDGLDPGEVTVRADRVQILTVHKGKGLEWNTVVVPNADAATWSGKAETFLTQARFIPSVLRGDATTSENAGPAAPGAVPAMPSTSDAKASGSAAPSTPGDAPVVSRAAGALMGAPAFETFAEDRSQFEKAGKDYIAAVRGTLAGEALRLFYVAITRSEQRLFISGSATTTGRLKPVEPYGPFALLRDAAPDCIGTWQSAPDDVVQQQGSVDKLLEAFGMERDDAAPSAVRPQTVEDIGTFPRRPADWAGSAARAAEIQSGAELVAAAMTELPARGDDDLAALWEADVNALIAEHDALRNPVVDVEFSGEATATDLVNLRRNPTQFARRLRRPVPFKPNTYAKRGTAFHQWLEDLFGGQSFLDEDQLPGLGEEVLSPDELTMLKERFLASEWSQRTPRFVELPFEVTIGSTVVRGRMDAVFHQHDGSWQVIDWKTGQIPRGEERRAAEIQLAVYVLAFRELLDAWSRAGTVTPEEAAAPVTAAFHYVAAEHTLVPSVLLDRNQLAGLIAKAVTPDLR